LAAFLYLDLDAADPMSLATDLQRGSHLTAAPAVRLLLGSMLVACKGVHGQAVPTSLAAGGSGFRVWHA
jgi:hypothetical protein